MTLMIFILFIFLFIGVPIGFSFALSGLLGGCLSGLPLGTLTGTPYQAVSSFPLMAIPFFLLAGELMNQGKLIDRLVDFTDFTLSWLKGRLGYVTVISSAFLGAMTGSSVATVAAIGGSIGERMVKKGYKRSYVAAVIASSGLLGVLIPPSIPLIVYGSAVGASVAELFLATIVPGILMTTIFLAMHRFMIPRVLVKNESDKQEESAKSELNFYQNFTTTIWKSMPALILPIIILGGIYSGVFTPTEAAAAAGVYAILVILFGRMIRLNQLPNIFYRATLSSIAILTIIAFTSIFNKVLIFEQVPQKIAELAIGLTDSPFIFLIITNVLLFLVGMFMETNAAVLLMAPLLYPAAMEFGIDPIHFGIILVTNIEIGLITPPMAANLYVSSKVNKSPLVEMLPYVARFLTAAVIGLLLITYIPMLSLWYR